MRTKTLEIRWHDTSPIFSSDFQPLAPHALKKLLNLPSTFSSSSSSTSSNSAGGGKEKEKEHVVAGGRSYRLATGGADNHVRLWLIHPNIPESSSSSSSTTNSSLNLPPVTPPPPRAEFLATLKRHTASVNVVRWSPKEELLASAGDDGFVLLWVPKPTSSDGASSTSMSASSSAFGDSAGGEEGQKEFWRVKMMVRPTTNEIYDLAWSPDGAHFIVGSTGTCIKAIADHSHYVQGVAWDPLNEFIATQSSDRAVHIHRIHQNKGELEFHPHNRAQKMEIHHSRTPSFSSSTSSSTVAAATRPVFPRRGSTAASETDSVITSAASEHGEDNHSLLGASSSKEGGGGAPLTPTASLPGTPSLASLSSSMKPPSRRSSFSSSVAASPPPPNFSAFPASAISNSGAGSSRYGRSPSPLPAIRPNSSSIPVHPSSSHPRSTSTKLYGDESYTHYFRRLTFSPDGALLLTPAGQIEDGHLSFSSTSDESGKPKRTGSNETGGGASKPTVYIYSRANLHGSPVAHLPGQKTASVAVKFSPIFYELRNVGTPVEPVKTIVVDEKSEGETKVWLGSSSSSSSTPVASTSASVVPTPPTSSSTSPRKPSTFSAPQPTHLAPSFLGSPSVVPSSSTSPGPGSLSPAPSQSVFALPYRMFFAVATQDAVLLYDTQQTGPIAIFVGLHYAGFTDLAWSPDGQTLILSSIDGYCSVVVFDPSELGTLHPTQQHQKQLQAIAHNLSAPHPLSLPPSPALTHAAPAFAPASVSAIDALDASMSSSSSSSSVATGAVVGEKRVASTSTSGGEGEGSTPAEVVAEGAAAVGGAKKKRRIELQHM
ncbi:WD40-repeat-containing domain protein [Mrakia frigida]|uniref:Cac2p n=1 Tax=Mrakia frigida TaxID=29902 RepID=UPI003FCBF621